MSTLDGPIWRKRSIALTCLEILGLASPGHNSITHRARKDGARVGINATAHQEKEENEETKKDKRGAGEIKRENKRPSLRKLCAALLRFFRGQHSQKMKTLHQSTAASTWWCGPRPRLGWVEMDVGFPEGLSYPGHSYSFFRKRYVVRMIVS